MDDVVLDPVFSSSTAQSPTSTVIKQIDRVSALRGWSLDGIDPEPLTGLTNHSYRVSVDGEWYVLRLPGRGTERYIDRRQEAHNARIAAELGIAPALHRIDTKSGATLTHFLEGSHALARNSLASQETLGHAVDLLHRLHHSGRCFRGRLRPFPMIDHYLALLNRDGTAHRQLLVTLMQRMNRIRALYKARGDEHPPSPCHIDPVPGNLLAGAERIWLIDWEYSAMCEPMWDLACLAVEASLNADERRQVLTRYYGTTSHTTWPLFAVYRLLVNVVSLAWTAVQIEQRNSSLDFATEYRRRHEQTLELLDEPMLNQHLGALSFSLGAGSRPRMDQI